MTTPNYYLTFGEDTFNRVGRLSNPIEEYMFMKWTSMKYRDRIGLKPNVDPKSDLRKILNLEDKMNNLIQDIIPYIIEQYGRCPPKVIDRLVQSVSLYDFYKWLYEYIDETKEC